MNHYLWIDLETTGLDPERCGIIEIAAVLTTPDMEVLAEYEALVGGPPYGLAWEDGALALHSGNGLLERWATESNMNKFGPGTCAKGIAQLLMAYEVRRPMLAGSSVHFDRRFIARHMGLLHPQLHYRHLDVSAITEMMINLGYPMPEVPPSDHTAMADIKRSMAIYRHWRDVVGGAE